MSNKKQLTLLMLIVLAVFAVILLPKKTKKQIKRNAEDMADDVKDKAKPITKKVTNIADDAQVVVSKTVRDVQEKVSKTLP